MTDVEKAAFNEGVDACIAKLSEDLDVLTSIHATTTNPEVHRQLTYTISALRGAIINTLPFVKWAEIQASQPDPSMS